MTITRKFGLCAAEVFAATEIGDAVALSELLGRLSVSPDTLGEDGDTALHMACLYGETLAAVIG